MDELLKCSENGFPSFKDQERIGELFTYPKDNLHGYIAITLINKELKVCITVGMGTDPNVLGALAKGHYLTDALLANDKNSICHERAIEYAQHVKEKIADPSGYELFYFGHSLDGHISHLQAAVVGGTAIGFDTPLLTEGFLLNYQNRLKVSYAELKFNPNFITVQSNPNLINQAGNTNELYGVQLRVDLTGDNVPKLSDTLPKHNMFRIYQEIHQGNVFEGERVDGYCQPGRQLFDLVPRKGEKLKQNLHRLTETDQLIFKECHEWMQERKRLDQSYGIELDTWKPAFAPAKHFNAYLKASQEIGEDFDPVNPDHQQLLRYHLSDHLPYNRMAIDQPDSGEWVHESNNGVDTIHQNFFVNDPELLEGIQNLDPDQIDLGTFGEKIEELINTSAPDEEPNIEEGKEYTTSVDKPKDKEVEKVKVTGVYIGPIGAGYNGVNVNLSNGSSVGIGVTTGERFGDGAGAIGGCVVVVKLKLSSAGLAALTSTATLTTLGVGVALVAIGATIKYFCNKHAKHVSTKVNNNLKNTAKQIDFIIKNVAPQLSQVQENVNTGKISYQQGIEQLNSGIRHLNQEQKSAEERARFSQKNGHKDAFKDHLKAVRLQAELIKSANTSKADLNAKDRAKNASEAFKGYSPDKLLDKLKSVSGESGNDKYQFYLAIEIGSILLDKVQDCGDPTQAETFLNEITTLKIFAPGNLDTFTLGKGYGKLDENTIKDLNRVNRVIKRANTAIGKGEDPTPILKHLEAVLLEVKKTWQKNKGRRLGDNSNDEYNSRYVKIDNFFGEVNAYKGNFVEGVQPITLADPHVKQNALAYVLNNQAKSDVENNGAVSQETYQLAQEYRMKYPESTEIKEVCSGIERSFISNQLAQQLENKNFHGALKSAELLESSHPGNKDVSKYCSEVKSTCTININFQEIQDLLKSKNWDEAAKKIAELESRAVDKPEVIESLGELKSFHSLYSSLDQIVLSVETGDKEEARKLAKELVKNASFSELDDETQKNLNGLIEEPYQQIYFAAQQVLSRGLAIINTHFARFGSKQQVAVLQTVSTLNQMIPYGGGMGLLLPKAMLDGDLATWQSIWGKQYGKQVRTLKVLSGETPLSVGKFSRLASLAFSALHLLPIPKQYHGMVGNLGFGLRGITTTSALYSGYKAYQKGKSLTNLYMIATDLSIDVGSWALEKTLGAPENVAWYFSKDGVKTSAALILPPPFGEIGFGLGFMDIQWKMVTGYYEEQVVKALLENIQYYESKEQGAEINLRISRISKVLKEIPVSSVFSSEYYTNCKYVNPGRFDKTNDSPIIKMAKLVLFDYGLRQSFAAKNWDEVIRKTNKSRANPKVTSRGNIPMKLIVPQMLQRLQAFLSKEQFDSSTFNREFQYVSSLVGAYKAKHKNTKNMGEQLKNLDQTLSGFRDWGTIRKFSNLINEKMDSETFCEEYRATFENASDNLKQSQADIRKSARNAYALLSAKTGCSERRVKFLDRLKFGFEEPNWQEDLEDESFYFVGHAELASNHPVEAIKNFDKIPMDKKHYGVWHDLANALLKKYSRGLNTPKEMAFFYLTVDFCLTKALELCMNEEINDQQKANIKSQLQSIRDTNPRNIIEYYGENPNSWTDHLDGLTKFDGIIFDLVQG